ncbi:MAG: hypothetical protein E6I84_14945 [Chloroflexi bacterium]|nr:MAG: hypothetical protein E6I84_14945 [Chloroflexota bacterium]
MRPPSTPTGFPSGVIRIGSRPRASSGSACSGTGPPSKPPPGSTTSPGSTRMSRVPTPLASTPPCRSRMHRASARLRSATGSICFPGRTR